MSGQALRAKPSRTTDPSLLDRCFPGETDMARRMRAFDWSQSPLGPPETWPVALQSSVSTSLNCAFPIVIWAGPELTIFYNDEYRAMLGPKHPDALGRPGAEVWSEIWDVIAPMLSQVMEQGIATRSRDLLLHIDRGYPEEAYFSFSYSPIFADDGRVVGVFCPVIETTEKVIGERRLRTLRDLASRCKGAASEGAAYHAAAEVLAANPHDIPFALLYQVDHGALVATRKAWTGFEPEDAAAPRQVVLGAGHDDPWSLGPVACSGTASMITDLESRFGNLPTGAWKASPERALVQPVLLPGEERPHAILVTAVSPMRGLDEDHRTFFTLVATQIAAGLADAEALHVERQRSEGLAQIDRAKTAFFSNVSHEFRTPLTLILGPLEDAIHETDDPAQRERLELLRRSALRLQKLVNSLLDFSRIEAGRIEASYRPVDLAQMTSELASVFRSSIEKAGIRLEVQCPPLSEPVYVDRDMYEKIVLNLLSNAFKFTLEGTIEVRLIDAGSTVELTVRDTGEGIAPEHLPHVFERFRRVEGVRSRTHEGTGIGLALVHELVKLHGGWVGVQSVPGKGSTFTVSLPKGNAHLPADRIQAESTLAPTGLTAHHYLEEALQWQPDSARVLSAPTDLPSAAARWPRGPRARIVWADDNVDMRDYVTSLLAPLHDVEAVPDGEAALNAIRRQAPELVIADVMMPRLDGFGLIAALRADPALRDLPVMLLSARAGEEAEVEGLHAGANDYLVKPFHARELLARVAMHIEVNRTRNRVLSELRQREEQLSAIIQQTTAGIAQTDLDGRFVLVNDRFAEMVGRTADELRALRAHDITHPEDRPAKDRLFADLVRTGEPYVIEKRYMRPDGIVTWTRNNVSLMRDGDGRPAGVLVAAMDITERKLAEEREKKQQERARLLWEAAGLLLSADEPDEMLQQLFRSIAPTLQIDVYLNYMVDDTGKALRLQSSAGISDDVAQSISRLEFGQAICGNVAIQRRGIVATHIQQSTDPKCQLVRSFGIRAYACNPLITAGRLLGTLSFASRTRDEFDPEEIAFLETVSHYVTVAYERLRLLNMLRESDQRKDEFLAILAHELRNPLAPVRNAAHLVKLGGFQDPDLRRPVEMIERQVTHMARLIDDLLDVSRISRGILELRPSRVDFDEILEPALDACRDDIDLRGHTLRVKVADEPLPIDGDRHRLIQVMCNLISNAAKYTPPGGTVEITAHRRDAMVEVRVQDNGIGIPPDQLSTVFELFAQVDRSLQREGGLGIGLTLARQLVELHHGTIEAESAGIGHGTTVTLTLPLATSAPAAPVPEPGPRPARKRLRILIADDNQDAADSLALLLEAAGHDVRRAYDGASALDLAAEFSPEVAFIDIGMPKIDGYELARRVRSTKWGKPIHLVAVTGWGQDSDRQRTRQAGFDAHFVKPASPDAITQLLADLSDAKK